MGIKMCPVKKQPSKVPSDFENLRESYRRYLNRKLIFIVILTAILVIIAGISTIMGSYPIGFFEVYSIIFHYFLNNTDTVTEFVVMDLRLPRVIMGIFAGFGLAVAGTVMQCTLKNPLADPYTTGISAGAGFGAAIAIILNLSFFSKDLMIIGNAFIFSVLLIKYS